MKRETFRKLIPPALLAAAASIAIAASHEDSDKTYSAKELRAHAVKIADRSTGCYALGQGEKPNSRTELVQGVRMNILTVPVHDTSTHRPGQDSWPNPPQGNGQGTNLLESGFIVSYSMIGDEQLDEPVQGTIRSEPGTTPQSTEFNLQLGVPTDRPGRWTADIHYAADVIVTNSHGAEPTLRGTRLCGSIDFNVGNDGSVADIHVTPPASDEANRLHLVTNPDPNTVPYIGNWYLPE